MSLSNPKQSISSPVKRYYKWNADKGQMAYYDKETETTVLVDEPFKMIPVDQFSCVEGYNAKAGKGFRSNEVKSTKNEDLIVNWNGGGNIITGKYADIKEKIESLGGKYHSSVYFATPIDGKLELCNLRIKGAGMSAWLDLNKTIKSGVEGNQLTVTKSELQKTGKVEYYSPVFKISKPTMEDYNAAVELDRDLQEYIKRRVEMKTQTEEEFLGSDVDSTPLTEDEKKQLKKPTTKKTEKWERHWFEADEESEEDLFNSIN